MRVTFTEELQQLEASLHEEGDLVLRALRSSLNALARGDSELADEVIGFDDEIDRRYFAIEEGVQSLLARQTPVAVDLRLVLAVLRVNLHLERMADYCVTVAKLTKLMGDLAVEHGAIASSIEDMGQRAEQMIRVALEAFADRDAAKAESLTELDEPASALDPISTSAIEDLMHELKRDYTLVIVTHNMQQAARVAEMTAFFSLDVKEDGSRNGILVEYDSTEKIFTQPADERTEGYVTGRFG